MFKINIDKLREVITFLLKFLDKYYVFIFGFILFYETLPILKNRSLSIDFKILSSLLFFAAFTAYKEVRRDIKLIPFIIICIPFLLFLKYINAHGYEFWGKILNWQISQQVVFDLNPIFKNIPFNDATFARIYKNDTLTWFMRFVYNNGFVLPVLIPIYRAAIAKDFKKMVTYLCSAHVFQIFLISPFYRIFHLQEVWFVLGQPDGLARKFTSYKEAAGWTLNCFPSMHTSISFAMFLLVLREKDLIFKTVWGFFCLSVIFSTMYLEIHWVIDVLAGLVLAYSTVKLADFIIDFLEKKLSSIFSSVYYKGDPSIFGQDNSASVNLID